MNKVINKIAIAVITAAAFGMVACDDSSSPAAPEQEVSKQEKQKQNPDDPNPASSETVQNSSESNEQPASSSDKVVESSSSAEVNGSSSSVTLSSASRLSEKCVDMDLMCPKCEGKDCPLLNEPCNTCNEEGLMAKDCNSDSVSYVCLSGLWEEYGVLKQQPYCMDIAPTPCKELEEGCGYRLCDPNGPQEATDCGNKKVYVCENGMWEIKYDVETCPPGGDCDGDGIPDGVRRLDLEPCEDGADPLEFYGRSYVCQDNKWVYAPAPDYDDSEIATDVSAMHRGGPAVTPRVVKVFNSSGTVTFQDDGVLVDDECTFNGLTAKLSNDTLYAALQYPGCSETGGSMGVVTFTLSKAFAGAKYIKYKDGRYVHKIYETDELLPCGNTSSCRTCAEGLDCGGRVF